MDKNYKQPIENFSIYNINQITLGEHAHRKYCGPPPQPARPQQGQLIWREASSSGKGPAHLERGQLI